jgi:acyl-coenzyme A thioesterase PaaI-like protein
MLIDGLGRGGIEYKINLLRPAQGDRFVARGNVVRAGQTLTVCSGDVFAHTGAVEKLIATLLATVFAAPERDNLKQ